MPAGLEWTLSKRVMQTRGAASHTQPRCAPSTQDEALLLELRKEGGLSYVVIAARLGRTVDGVKMK